MRVSVVQMNPGADKSENIALQARRLIDEAVEADRPNIVSLPEVWDSLGGDRTVRSANAELLPAKGSNEPGGPAYEFLRETARARRFMCMAARSSSRGRRSCSTPPWYSIPTARRSRATARCNLFDIVAPDGTGYRESTTYGSVTRWSPTKPMARKSAFSCHLL